MPAATPATVDTPAVSHQKKPRRLGAPAGGFCVASGPIAVHPMTAVRKVVCLVAAPPWAGHLLLASPSRLHEAMKATKSVISSDVSGLKSPRSLLGPLSV